MAVKTSFFWDGSDEYGQEEIAAVHQATIRPGIMVADDGSLCFAVTAGSGTVSITAGIAHLSGPAWLYKKTSTTLNVPTPTNYGRIDRVVLYADFVNKSVISAKKQNID
ncbi:MAG: hypothetical protein RSA63_00715, partial [Eubacterium sp.]